MAASHTLRKIDGRPIPDRAGEIRACLVVRNEALRLPSTLEHYRRLGVDRFLVIDNGSDDGTTELLRAQPDTHVFLTNDSFAESRCGLNWTNTILDQFAGEGWILTVDADELFVYPHYEQVPLHAFCGFLDSVEARSVFSIMVDMYANARLDEAVHTPGGLLLETCAYFDRGPYRQLPAPRFPYIQVHGGVRERLFRDNLGNRYSPPVVSKLPLVKWRAGMRYLASTHYVTPAPMAEVTAGLLHFKFLHDFPERVATEVERAEHYGGAFEYKAYVEALGDGGAANLFSMASERYRDSTQLVAMALMRTSPAYERFADAVSLAG